jgi:hypothetical protein
MEPLLISYGVKRFIDSAKDVTKNKVSLKLLLIFVTISVTISCNAQRSGGAKVDVTGNWQITISVAEGTIIGKGSLSQTGDVVTGWVGPRENDPISITGMFKKGKLIIKTSPQPGRTVAFDQVELTVNVDTLSGAIENGSHGKGTIKFIRSK